jgi:CDGSH iron-sulfur domain-containing protein 3
MSEAGKARGLPWALFVEAGAVVRCCGCGRSVQAPLCRHESADDTCSPSLFVADRSEWVWLCGCAGSATPPLCDGSHRRPVER